MNVAADSTVDAAKEGETEDGVKAEKPERKLSDQEAALSNSGRQSGDGR